MEPAAQIPPQTGWWSRNWKWFMPTGCCLGLLIGIVVMMVVFGVGFFTIFTGVSQILKSSEPYKVAVARAKADEKVIAALGTPISEGIIPSGSVNANGASGNADLSISISGPKGKGTIYVVATKSGGEWTYSKLAVKIDATGETIDLGP